MKGLYVILDSKTLGKRSPERVARSVIRGGASALQFRAKAMGDAQLFATCRRLQQLCREKNIPFIVNDRCDVAASVGAAGVHLGQEDLPLAAARKILGRGKIIGLSTHSVHEALRAARQKPGYVALGPIFRSKTKRARRPLLGLAALRRVALRTHHPIVAIGGMDSMSAADAISAGAGAVAVVRDILKSGNPGRMARKMAQAISGRPA